MITSVGIEHIHIFAMDAVTALTALGSVNRRWAVRTMKLNCLLYGCKTRVLTKLHVAGSEEGQTLYPEAVATREQDRNARTMGTSRRSAHMSLMCLSYKSCLQTLTNPPPPSLRPLVLGKGSQLLKSRLIYSRGFKYI
jgi:hypothetical protein